MCKKQALKQAGEDGTSNLAKHVKKHHAPVEEVIQKVRSSGATREQLSDFIQVQALQHERANPSMDRFVGQAVSNPARLRFLKEFGDASRYL